MERFTEAANMISYSYDETGLRTRKGISGTQTWFDRDAAGNLVHETRNDGANHLYYYYDANGSIGSISYNGVRYAFRKNLQGDVIAILDTDGEVVARYTYDAWGKVLSVTDANGNANTSSTFIGNVNPIRYRGYYYDKETGWYYLNSRYYDPEVKRFINADTTDILSATGNLYDKNLFAYCDNNPVMRVDVGGEFWDTIFDVVSLVASIVDVVSSPSDPMAWAGLGTDVVCLVTPGLTGGGTLVRAASKADDVVDAVRAVDRVDDVVDTVNTAKKVDFYVTPMGDTIPATLPEFNNNLSRLENRGGKFYGVDSRGPVRIRVEQHFQKPGWNGPYNPYHCEPHFHIDRRQNGWSGGFQKSYTGLMRWLR